MTNDEKIIEIAENAKLPLSFLNETDEVLRSVNTCSKKGYFKTAIKYGALQMAQWKDSEFEKEKQQWIDKACDWLEYNLCRYDENYHELDSDNSLIKDFKKAMEE